MSVIETAYSGRIDMIKMMRGDAPPKPELMPSGHKLSPQLIAAIFSGK